MIFEIDLQGQKIQSGLIRSFRWYRCTSHSAPAFVSYHCSLFNHGTKDSYREATCGTVVLWQDRDEEIEDDRRTLGAFMDLFWWLPLRPRRQLYTIQNWEGFLEFTIFFAIMVNGYFIHLITTRLSLEKRACLSVCPLVLSTRHMAASIVNARDSSEAFRWPWIQNLAYLSTLTPIGINIPKAQASLPVLSSVVTVSLLQGGGLGLFPTGHSSRGFAALCTILWNSTLHFLPG
jgi:hypothetical protein